jgi:nitrogen regulatory protein P-II 1
LKLIVAIIQPQELTPIKEALVHENIFRFTISNALGQGEEIPVHEVYRGIAHDIKLLKKVRLEIAVNDEFVDQAVNAICSVAGTDDSGGGRGKIFILPIEECIRIRTGERGAGAIG